MVDEREQLRQIKLKALRPAIQDGLDTGFSEPRDIVDIKTEGHRILAARKGA
jgi:hypothetical protein